MKEKQIKQDFYGTFQVEILQKSNTKSFTLQAAGRFLSPSDSLPAPRQSSPKRAWCCQQVAMHPRAAMILNCPAA
ncbi:MAG: hypothetical protein J5698_05020 [Bacteroidaceae bacterium]|nr:hypothetical protein [Bacteroidaceae bacterium]